MVAIKTGKLNYRDVWPDAIWTDHDWLRWRAVYALQVKREGLAGHKAHFRLTDLLSAHQRRTSPSYSERQQIWQRLYPMVRSQGWLSDQEIEYLLDLLSGVNHPTGQDILEKLREKEKTNAAE